MKAYLSYFKIRVINGLQYRAAAFSGCLTQFAWGGMTILMFRAFYEANPENFPMTFEQLSTYIWLQQALLALFMVWYMDNEIFDNISNGNICYELCRPIKLYNMWFVKTLSHRVYSVMLRCIPIFLVGFFLPHPFGITLPVDILAFLLFIISIILGVFIMISVNMLIYITAFYTISSHGIRILAISIMELLLGGIIPIPFFPKQVAFVLNLLPFASIQNTPFLIYNGYLKSVDAYFSICVQVVWLVILFFGGKLLIKNALKKVVVQGG